MAYSIAEALGALVVLVALGLIVGAASMVSAALAWLAAGVFLLAIGGAVVYVAASLDVRARATAAKAVRS